MKTLNTKRQGGFFAIGVGFGLVALAAVTGLTVNAAVSEDEQRASTEQQVQVATAPVFLTPPTTGRFQSAPARPRH